LEICSPGCFAQCAIIAALTSARPGTAADRGSAEPFEDLIPCPAVANSLKDAEAYIMKLPKVSSLIVWMHRLAGRALEQRKKPRLPAFFTSEEIDMSLNSFITLGRSGLRVTGITSVLSSRPKTPLSSWVAKLWRNV